MILNFNTLLKSVVNLPSPDKPRLKGVFVYSLITAFRTWFISYAYKALCDVSNIPMLE